MWRHNLAVNSVSRLRDVEPHLIRIGLLDPAHEPENQWRNEQEIEQGIQTPMWHSHWQPNGPRTVRIMNGGTFSLHQCTRAFFGDSNDSLRVFFKAIVRNRFRFGVDSWSIQGFDPDVDGRESPIDFDDAAAGGEIENADSDDEVSLEHRGERRGAYRFIRDRMIVTMLDSDKCQARNIHGHPVRGLSVAISRNDLINKAWEKFLEGAITLSSLKFCNDIGEPETVQERRERENSAQDPLLPLPEEYQDAPEIEQEQVSASAADNDNDHNVIADSDDASARRGMAGLLGENWGQSLSDHSSDHRFSPNLLLSSSSEQPSENSPSLLTSSSDEDDINTDDLCDDTEEGDGEDDDDSDCTPLPVTQEFNDVGGDDGDEGDDGDDECSDDDNDSWLSNAQHMRVGEMNAYRDQEDARLQKRHIDGLRVN